MNYRHTRTQLYEPQERAVKQTSQTRRGLGSELPSGLVNVRNSQQGVEGKKRLFACAASAVVQMERRVIGFQSRPRSSSWQRDLGVNTSAEFSVSHTQKQ